MTDTQVTNPVQAAAEAAEKAQEQVRAQTEVKTSEVLSQVATKIAEANNVLVALSKNPSVDEMAAAIGLTLFLDGLGKHATAIYSGSTPNALQFLKPGDTFEDNTNSLRDFIIALNKEKADHLRYKLDGDYVKVYITPYKTMIDENDLEFSHGDYNVDLVVALNVPTANDLDAALTEHGRIMHDAGAVDITTGEPGKFGEIEWSDPKASSVSELVTQLVLKLQTRENTMTANEATAFLTGIVAETERFSNEKTTPSAMAMASKLMELGADQQLVATNIEENSMSMGAIDGTALVDAKVGNDPTTLNVRGGSEEKVEAESELKLEPEPELKLESEPELKLEPKSELKLEPELKPELGPVPTQTESVTPTVESVESAPETNASETNAPETPAPAIAEPAPVAPVEPNPVTPEVSSVPEMPSVSEVPPVPEAPVTPEVPPAPEVPPVSEAPVVPEVPPAPEVSPVPEVSAPMGAVDMSNMPVAMPGPIGGSSGGLIEDSVKESADFSANTPSEHVGLVGGVGQTIQPEPGFEEGKTEQKKDYGAMIDAALAEGVPSAPEAPEANSLPEMDYAPQQESASAAPQPTVQPMPTPQPSMQPVSEPVTQPTPEPVAVPPVTRPTSEPVVPPAPVLPMPSEDVVLPPPPAPNVDFSQVLPTDANGAPVLPQVQETQPAQPAPQPVPQPTQPMNDPSAFRIPGT